MQTQMRDDVDSLLEPCAFPLTSEASHYIDYAPGLSPLPSEKQAGHRPMTCPVDIEGAKEYLSALREARIWPSACWSRPKGVDLGLTMDALVDRIKNFKEPEYDDSDHCDGCTMLKIQFTEQLDTVKEDHAKRLWGLCLDCFKGIGGVQTGECRYEHEK
jgi:hypothetical protein